MKLTPAQVRALQWIVNDERYYKSPSTLNVLLKAGLIVGATDTYYIDGSWTPTYVPSVDAHKFLQSLPR